MSTKTEPPITGTISHGTLRDDDLLAAFLGALDMLDADAARALAPEVGAVLLTFEQDDEPAYEQAGWLLERLDDAISAALPEGWYFGTTEGDGSDFGIWRAEDEDDEDRDDMDLALEYIRGEIQAERISMGEIAWLQDHAAWISPDDPELLEWAGIPEDERYRPGQGTGQYLDNPEQGV